MACGGKIELFRDVISTVSNRSDLEWVFLDEDGPWTLDSASAVLTLDEVPPELENDPNAGIPEFAVVHGLIEAVSIATLQDIVSNALQQRESASLDELFSAFTFYWSNDAFIQFD